MKKSLILFLIFTYAFVSAQDSYHTELIGFLSEEFDLEGHSFVLFDNETEIVQTKFTYGDIQVSEVAEGDLGFSSYTSINVPVAGTNPWDAGYGIRNVNQVNRGDAIIVHFWARRNSSSGSVNGFSEDGATFEKEFFNFFELTDDWTSYFYSFKSLSLIHI